MSVSMLLSMSSNVAAISFFLHEHAGGVVGAKEDRSKNVPWGHPYYGNVCIKRLASECSVGDAKTEDSVKAKVDLRNGEALDFVTCHCCRDGQ